MILLGRGTLISPLLATLTQTTLCIAKRASATPFVCGPYALFHFPYPVSPVFATATKIRFSLRGHGEFMPLSAPASPYSLSVPSDERGFS